MGRLAVFGVVLLGALQLSSSSQALPPTDSADLRWLSNPDVKPLVLGDGEVQARRITDSGAFQRNSRGPLEIVGQSHGFDVIAAGVVAAEPEKSALLDRGLAALEWGFKQMNPDGTFPQSARHQSPVASPAFFLGAAARSVLLLQGANVPSSFKGRASRLVPPIEKAALALIDTPDFAAFAANTRLSNQKLAVAVAIQEASILGGKPALADVAARLVNDVLKQQQSDGTVPEEGGFDANYQSVSLELLTQYADLTPSSRARIVPAIQRGTARLLAIVSGSGAIDARGNTRTAPCGAAVGGRGAKGAARDALPLRLYYANTVLQDTRVEATARNVQAFGQRFTHFAECSSGAR